MRFFITYIHQALPKKLYRDDIAEILLKVVLNTINQPTPKTLSVFLRYKALTDYHTY